MSDASIKKDISCKDDFDPNSILPEQALEKIFATIKPVTETETLPIREALGRVLVADIKSDINVPSGRNSAMDGYAVNAEDLPQEGTTTLKLVGTSFAGTPFSSTLNKGECVRIMTGAIMPEGSDTVIIQEDVDADGDDIRIDGETKPVIG